MSAFGITCAVLVRTHDPFLGKSSEDILLNKIDMGTFSTLIENERLPSNILELLRGLLYDDPETRWSVHDVQKWMDSRRDNIRSQMREERLFDLLIQTAKVTDAPAS